LRICRLYTRSTVASCDCITSLLTGGLLYKGFTFDAPDPPLLYRASVNYIHKIDSRVSRLHNFLLTGTLLYARFTFDSPECQSYIYSKYICAYTGSPRSNTVLSYISAIQDCVIPATTILSYKYIIIYIISTVLDYIYYISAPVHFVQDRILYSYIYISSTGFIVHAPLLYHSPIQDRQSLRLQYTSDIDIYLRHISA
jgi:hypothetical protein